MNIDFQTVFICFAIVWLFYHSNVKEYFSGPRVKKCNKKDGRCHPVAGIYKPETFKDASYNMAHVNLFIVNFLRHMRNKYVFNSNGEYRKKMTLMMLRNYNPDNLLENVPQDQTTTSYVENKGDVFAVCLREKVTGTEQFHDTHLLEFVTLHELAHLSTDDFGHTDTFWSHMKLLVAEAKEAKLHYPIDYSIHPKHYCSISINHNPYYDVRISYPPK
jgi:hypothetical protein